MTVLTDGRHTAEYIASEANGTRSRDVVTLITGQNLAPGAVLGKITASGKYTAVDPAASDGSQTAAAVLFDPVDASAADKPAVVTLRDTEVKAVALVWPSGISGPDKTTALGQLASLGILAR